MHARNVSRRIVGAISSNVVIDDGIYTGVASTVPMTSGLLLAIFMTVLLGIMLLALPRLGYILETDTAEKLYYLIVLVGVFSLAIGHWQQ